jgi:hypothetical protein
MMDFPPRQSNSVTRYLGRERERYGFLTVSLFWVFHPKEIGFILIYSAI